MFKNIRKSYHSVYIRLYFLLKMILKRKISFVKILNMLESYIRYYRKNPSAARHPSVVIFDVTNQCNLFCKTCRNKQGEMMDYEGADRPPIAMGSMKYELFDSIIEETAESLLAVVLYLSGEPLINKDVYRMVEKANSLSIPIVFSTNGMLLNEEASYKLVNGGVDYIKIAISGFTQETYEIFHRGGKINVILENMRKLVEARRNLASGLMIVMDFIVFPYNKHEIKNAKRFCKDLGIFFNTRKGFLIVEEGKSVPTEKIRPYKKNCDWLWTIMAVGWDAKVLPCCNYYFTGGPLIMGRLGAGLTVSKVWNSECFQKYRLAHITYGRRAFKICKNCRFEGIKFQF